MIQTKEKFHHEDISYAENHKFGRFFRLAGVHLSWKIPQCWHGMILPSWNCDFQARIVKYMGLYNWVCICASGEALTCARSTCDTLGSKTLWPIYTFQNMSPLFFIDYFFYSYNGIISSIHIMVQKYRVPTNGVKAPSDKERVSFGAEIPILLLS